MSGTGLTEKEVKLLEKSYKELSQDPEAMSKVFYEFFKQYPQYQKYTIFRNAPLDELLDDTNFKIQCVLVTIYMTACIENLNDYDVAKGILIQLGRSHKKYNLPTESFWESRDVIVKGLSNLVDEETHKAHVKYWDFVVTGILEGMEK